MYQYAQLVERKTWIVTNIKTNSIPISTPLMRQINGLNGREPSVFFKRTGADEVDKPDIPFDFLSAYICELVSVCQTSDSTIATLVLTNSTQNFCIL